MRTTRWLLVAAAALAACGSGASRSATTGAARISLVAYSTPQEAYGKLIRAFQATPQGKGVTFSESYGASGDQSRAVEAGLAADIVAFSLEPDMTRLVRGGIVPADWNQRPDRGFVTDSVVVLVVRRGNPKGIKGWSDLTRPGVEVITPNPFTSGGARWNVMAAYGATSKVGKDDAAGVSYLDALFHQVPVQDDSARKSLATFAQGKGDALLAYENEAIFAQQHGQAIDYVTPDQTILIENPIAVTARSRHPAQARAFLDFLYSATGQRIFADAGYRPTRAGVARAGEFQKPSGLFTIDQLGGWVAVNRRFFDPQAGVLVDVERRLGVSTEKR
jgi:sulfate transport system substrate-binding protein